MTVNFGFIDRTLTFKADLTAVFVEDGFSCVLLKDE
jgi:hypothetical protein